MRRDLLILVVLSALLGWAATARPSPTFRPATLKRAVGLTYLQDARLACLPPEAHALWLRGELRVDDQFVAGAGLVEDFDGDGIADRALPVQTDRSYLLLVVSPADEPTRLLATIDYLTKDELESEEFVRAQARGPGK